MNASRPPDSEAAPSLRSALDDLQRRVAELLNTGPAADLERNLRAVLAQGFDRLDLVSRDEIEQYLETIAALHKRVESLEARFADPPREAPIPPIPG